MSRRWRRLNFETPTNPRARRRPTEAGEEAGGARRRVRAVWARISTYTRAEIAWIGIAGDRSLGDMPAAFLARVSLFVLALSMGCCVYDDLVEGGKQRESEKDSVPLEAPLFLSPLSFSGDSSGEMARVACKGARRCGTHHDHAPTIYHHSDSRTVMTA